MPPKFSQELKKKTIFADNMDYQPRTSPCESYCPAGNPIQKMNTLIRDGHFEEAIEYIMARNPFPGICGRVCPHPCERECNRNNYDKGLSIRALERAAFDHADMAKLHQPLKREKTGKKIAIIGSGPTGMTCAYFSALFGHDVTVFEAQPSLGGMPCYCIPDYRLPKDVVDREIRQILELGIHSKTNTVIGRDKTLAEIMEMYDACLIAVGTWKEKTLDIPGGDLAINGITFLRQIKLGQRTGIGDSVVIIGGGGVAFDCAFSARRLGASEVHIVCLEAKEHMPAHPEDIQQGEEEGMMLHNSQMISKVLIRNGKATGIQSFDVASFRFEEDGKVNVSPASEAKNVISADTVIMSIGEAPDFRFLGGDIKFTLTKRGTLEVNPLTMATSVEGVFAAGDVVSGPSCVAEAIGSGRRAAVSIDRHLKKDFTASVSNIFLDSKGNIVMERCEDIEGKLAERHVVTYEELMYVDYFERKSRVETKKLAVSESGSSFEEINKGYVEEEAHVEAGRCFHCGHCFSCGSCVEDCPGYVLAMSNSGPEVTYPEECWHCGNCRISCPCGAVYYKFPLSMLV